MPRTCVSDCDVCGTQTEWRFAIHNRRDPLLRLVRIRRADFWVCQRCGLVRQIPKPPAARAQHVYETTEFRPESAEDARRGSMLARAAPDQYRWVTEQAGAIASGTVFDVGSGTGALLDEFKARGWQTFGVEPTPHFAAYAAARGHGVTAGFLGNHAEATYDLVTASHVLEHIAEPGPFLEAIRGRMRPDSRLFVEVPDIMRPYGHIWYLFFSVNHVYHYNSATLARLLTAHGFSVLAIEPGQRGLRVFCGLGTAPGMAVSGATPGDVLDSIHHYRSEFSARYFKEGIKEDVKLAARAVCGVLFGLRRGDRIYDAVSRAVRTSSGHRS